MICLKNGPIQICSRFFEPLFRRKISYKCQKLTSKSLRIQEPTNFAEDGTLNFLSWAYVELIRILSCSKGKITVLLRIGAPKTEFWKICIFLALISDQICHFSVKDTIAICEFCSNYGRNSVFSTKDTVIISIFTKICQ